MKPKKSYNIDENMMNKIINVSYGDYSLFDKIDVYTKAMFNPEIKKVLSEYKNTANAVHSIELEECPAEILETVKKVSGIKEVKEKSFFFDLYTVFFARPIFSTAAATVILIAILLSILIDRPEISRSYSQQEIDMANKQVRESLAIVGNIFNKTQTTIKKEILTTRVAKPFKEGINIVNDLFSEGGKNEKSN